MKRMKLKINENFLPTLKRAQREEKKPNRKNQRAPLCVRDFPAYHSKDPGPKRLKISHPWKACGLM